MLTTPVAVGQTPFPLKPGAQAQGPLPFTSAARPSGKEVRVLDGPPYANGAPHLGHVLNKHLKDAVARALHASGFAVEWRPGWDCHGLPIEVAVERQGVPRQRRLEFLAAARAYAQDQVDGQAEVFQAQGWAAEWERPWKTMDPSAEAATLRVLADLLERGALEVRFTAVPWCPVCESTLAGAEQEDACEHTEAWLVPFALGETFQDANEFLLSWTTTPWTLPLHRALVVHPDALYEALELPSGHTVWVSQATAERWSVELGANRSARLRLGEQWRGVRYATPWHESLEVASHPAVAADTGSGVLHAVPGLAELDTDLARERGWPVEQHLSPSGLVTASPCSAQVGVLAGPLATAPVRSVYERTPGWKPFDPLTSRAHCWRHKVPLLTRASRQVFLALDTGLRRRAEAMVEGMVFTPESARQRLLAAMATRPDWCLSRQRTWGVPLALFLDRRTGQPHALAARWMRRVADAAAEEGVEAWWSRDTTEWLAGDACEADVLRMDDVLDVWFDSGCVPQWVGPAHTVVEGSDQHRGWFQACVWVAAALEAPPPFEQVVSHGFVVRANGEKLAKSTGGDVLEKPAGLPPWSALNTDVVRVWALSGSAGADKAWTAATVQGASSGVARWRGVMRFLMANALPEPPGPVASHLPAWDRYWWRETERMADAVVAACAQGNTGAAVTAAAAFAEEFSAVCLGSWKDRLYCAPAHTVERRQLDGVVQACAGAWAAAMAVLAPRLAAEVAAHRQFQRQAERPVLEATEEAEVLEVLAVRRALAEAAETLSRQRVAPGRRRALRWPKAPRWPDQLLADALDVGQMGDEGDVPALEVAEDPCCPRCRRAQPPWDADACARCQQRCSTN